MIPCLTRSTNAVDPPFLKVKETLVVPSPALIVPLPVKRFPNKLAPNVPINILRIPPFCSSVSFLIVSLTPFINKPDSLRDLSIL